MRNFGVFDPVVTDANEGVGQELMDAWNQIRNPVIVPGLRIAVYVCAVMSLMLFVERVYMAIVILCVKVLGRKRYMKYNIDAVMEEMEANRSHPMVLVQVPMYNEKEVYKLSIGAACRLKWPADRIIIQVLDDSTDPAIKNLVEQECKKWANENVNIKYEIRPNRNGYKAGALREGLKKHYVRQCDHVAIFDADFQPDPEFLVKTIPFLVSNSELALVQARWKFVNANDCLMTRLQEMSLDYHFSVEQEVGSSTYSFFGFNGTAGVWRLHALTNSGGWKDRTTVEDMDLAARASLKGWKFVFVGDLSVKNELPSTYKAYKFQQHRWSCGPANLFKKMFKEIILCTRVTMWKKIHVLYALWKKIHVLYAFFFVRKIVAHLVTFFFYCVIFPACVLVPEVRIHKFISVYVPSIITILNALYTPRSLHLIIYWILFENVMSMHRSKATIIGLLEASRVNEWVVTEKLGNALTNLNRQRGENRARRSFIERVRESICRAHWLEMCMGFYLVYCGIFDIMYGRDYFWVYLFLQAGAFFVVGIGYIGTVVPT